jgi:ATP-dependent DNA helicase RecG
VVFPLLKVGLLHGRMKSGDKEATMLAFKNGETQVLVSTTVIEVGVDVPNATVMVIEHAERFGLAQLHQLRGRVGRGAAQSYCVLVTERLGEVARERIRTLVDSSDGFHIAEMDLKLRGPGEFLGTRQSGLPAFRIGNLIRDQEILEWARREATGFIAEPGSGAALAAAERYVRENWQQRYGLALIA